MRAILYPPASGLTPIPGAGGAWRLYKSRAPRRADERSCTSCRFSLPMPEPSFFHSMPSWGPHDSAASRRAVLLVTVNDSAPRQIVRRKLDRHAISRQNTNKVFAHLPGNMGQHLVLVLQLHAKHRVRQRLDHGGHDFDGVLFPALARFLVFLLWPWSHALLCSTPANLCFLPNRPCRFFGPRQNPRPVLRDRHRVLEVRRITAVRRHRGPLIIQHSHARAARIHHRFNSQHHALLQLGALTRRAIIR